MKPPIPQPPIQPPNSSEMVEDVDLDKPTGSPESGASGPKAGADDGGRSQGLVGDFGPLVDLPSTDDSGFNDKNP